MHSRDTRIVITGPSRQRRGPVVHVNMFHFSPPPRNGIRHPDMVQLLGVLVEDVRVPLGHWHIGDLVDLVHETVERLEDRARLDVLVVVSRDDDAGPGVDLQKRFDEFLGQETR